MPLSRYLKIYPDPEHAGYHFLYSTKKGSIVRLSEQLLAAARSDTMAESERATLQRLDMWVDDLGVERSEMAGIMASSNARSSRFNATVVLTLECNLACPYCFEDHFRGNHAMSEETSKMLVDYIDQEHISKGRETALRFYGGEPLLAIPGLKEIARPLQEAAQKAGTKFSCSLVTNGTLLTRQIVEELLPFGLTSAQVTLDGPKEIHDLQRPFISGNGSFDTIISNISDCFDLINLDLGGNFTRENYRDFPAMLDMLLAAGVKPDMVGPVMFAPVFPKSGRTIAPELAASCPSSTEPWVMDAALYLHEKTLKRGFRVIKPTMAACTVELDNELVVNWDGTLYKCPAFMGWPELSIGSLAEGINDYSHSHNLGLWQNDECLECPYLPICFGGCRLITMLKNGTIDQVDCRKDFYDAALERMIIQA